LVEGALGFTVDGVELGVRVAGLRGSIVKEAVGEWTADALMKEHEQQGSAGSLVAVSIWRIIE
jgi:hypothetical protein